MNKIFPILLLLFLISCDFLETKCSNRNDHIIPESIDEELIFAQMQIAENMDSLRYWEGINKRLAGQKAGVLANIGLWNYIDSGYLESITIENENLILFEFYTVSCDWNREYMIYNKDLNQVKELFEEATIKVDFVQPNWHLVKVKKG